MDVKKKILFVLPFMGGGGAERVVLTIIRYIDRTKFKPILVLFERKGNYLDLVPEDVEIIDLKTAKARSAVLKLPAVVRQHQPDYVFSSLGHVNLLIGLIRPFLPKKIQFIARESNTASVQIQQEKLSFISSLLYKFVYNNFDLIIAQSKVMKHDLVENQGTKAEKIVVLYNPVDIARIEELSSQEATDNIELPANKINLLAVGRLSYQKGFDYLIETMSKLDQQYYLTILGDGEDREPLLQQAEQLGVKDRIHFAGFTDNPYHLMKVSDLLVLSSRYEGLPNVVLEANTCGTPVVAFNSAGGTSEIVIDGVNGLLAEPFDTDQLAEKIVAVHAQGFDKSAIKKHVRDNFHVNKIVYEYEEHILKI